MNKIKNENQEKLEQMKDKLDSSKKEIIEAFEDRLAEKDRRIDTLNDNLDSITQKNNLAERELDKINLQFSQLEEELIKTKSALSLATKEKEAIMLKFEQ